MEPIHPQTRIGHVHLKVADLDRALAFYQGVLMDLRGLLAP
jgi:catechol 2,3-dioxygenase